MGWFFQFLNSSIGKKIQMAVTGTLLCLFLIIHLVGNLFLFAGAESFNNYVGTLSGFKPVVRVIEVILAAIFIGHIINAIRLTLDNRRAKPEKYLVNKAGETSTLPSRTMGVTGSIIFIFLVVHLSTIWYQFQAAHESGEFFSIVISDNIGFGNIIVTFLYIIAMGLLGFHLRHGFQSAFQTFGLGKSRWKPLIDAIAVFFWLIIPLGFVSIPIYFGLIAGGN